jgi:hypothetical protein
LGGDGGNERERAKKKQEKTNRLNPGRPCRLSQPFFPSQVIVKRNINLLKEISG